MPVRLDAGRLKLQAAVLFGESDFGDDPFAENFVRFVDALNSDGVLSPDGAAITEAEILGLLRNRLEIAGWLAREPSISDEGIDRPIFLMGLPRSGTTFLHHLFDHDPSLRLLRCWETLRPCPPPGFDPASVAPRLEAARQFVGQWQSDVVGFDATHLLDADGPDECSLILNQIFAQAGFQNYLQVRSHFDWLYDSADFVQVYRYHQSVLQLLQWRAGKRRWVLKFPNHLLAMREIREVHPNAIFVVSHRDPVKTLASLCDLTFQYRAPRYATNDREQIGREMWDFVVKHVDRLPAFRESGAAGVVDVDYYRLVADPVATVEAIYDAVGMEIPSKVRIQLGEWTAKNPKGKRGVHAYRLEDYGLDFEAVNASFADYRRLYSLPVERD
jgi:hypothetical protein